MAYSPYQQEDYEVAWRLAEAAYYPSAYSLRDNDVDALGADIGLAIGRDALIQRWYVNNALRDDVLPPNNDVPTPRASLLDMPYDTDEYYEGLANRRFVFAGAGAASILLASYLKIRGASPDNITMVDPRGSLGGMWREQWAQSGGFNNPRALKFGRKGKLGISDREGWRMETFLQGVAAVHLSNVRVLADELATAKRKPQGSWRAITKEGTKLKSDYLVFAQGATEPRPIDGTRM
ncbi:MAG: hypothetical protein QG553_235 [Patescibacteria group bacterium]|nr:hypothetical protein [Patescibacteria group bacterium]